MLSLFLPPPQAIATQESFPKFVFPSLTPTSDIMKFFINFQGYVYEGKQCQAHMEEIKGMVEDIAVFQ